MAKERKCRLTAEELEIHKQAVKLRKMTDKKLVETFNETKTVSNNESAANNINNIQRLLNELSEGKFKGIKSGIVHKLTEFCRELGLIE